MKLSFREPNALCARPCNASFFLAKLPALVAENPLAEAPLIMLRSVEELVFVVVLRVPDEEDVELVLVVKVRSSIDLPTS